MNISNPVSIPDGSLTNNKFAPGALAAVNFASDVSFGTMKLVALFTASGTFIPLETGNYLLESLGAGGGGASGLPNSGGTYSYLPGEPGANGSFYWHIFTLTAGTSNLVVLGLIGQGGVYNSTLGYATDGGVGGGNTFNGTSLNSNVPGGRGNNTLLSTNTLGCIGKQSTGGSTGAPGTFGSDINTVYDASGEQPQSGSGGCSGCTVVTTTATTSFSGGQGGAGYVKIYQI